jgi:putative SOS response-associated peptidase YedK
MCGRIFQVSPPDQLGLGIVSGVEGREHRFGNLPPRYNGAPSQELLVIRRHPETGENTLDPAPVGSDPVLGQGEAETAAHQRAC